MCVKTYTEAGEAAASGNSENLLKICRVKDSLLRKTCFKLGAFCTSLFR